MTSRPSARQANQMRDISITREFTKHAEGSVLIEFGETKVICTASVDARVPPFLKGQGSGWITAEYGMLPRATGSRAMREAAKGKQTGRTQEIQRLIGRSLRACVDLKHLGERTITLDCDVIQADGGTRTASITGAYIALVDSINYLIEVQELKKSPVISQVASVSAGIFNHEVVLDLDYAEDSKAETDMNIVMTNTGEFIEIQGTAEGVAFTRQQMNTMLDYAQKGINELIDLQNQALEL